MADDVHNGKDFGALVGRTGGGGAGARVSADPPKRGPGKPNPNGKIPGSGRKRGTPNRATTVGRQFIIDRSMAIPLLCDLAAGRQVSVADPQNPKKKIKVYPDMKERRAAAGLLAPMIVPVLRSTDFNFAMDGGSGNDLNFNVVLVKPMARNPETGKLDEEGGG